MRLWKAADGQVAIGALQNAEFVALCQSLGRDDLAQDERFGSSAGRIKHQREWAPQVSAEIARRRPDTLTSRQRELLAIYGYPYVIDEFRFHLTLTGAMTPDDHAVVAPVAKAYFADVVPQPFLVGDICMMGEDAAGRFHVLTRCALSG